MKCEECIYYGVPPGASETTKPDCMFEPDEENCAAYSPRSIEGTGYIAKIESIFDCFVEHGTENEKALDYVRCWAHCEWLANVIDEQEYIELQCTIDKAYTEYYLKP